MPLKDFPFPVYEKALWGMNHFYITKLNSIERQNLVKYSMCTSYQKPKEKDDLKGTKIVRV